MMQKFSFIKATIVGGLVFLLPLVVIVLIIGKALKISMVVAEPLGALIPIDSVGGVALANILAVLVILVLCYLAGLVAQFASIRRKVAGLEELLIAAIPGYAFAKTMVSGVTKAEDEAGRMMPVLVTLDDYKQIAFEVERTPGGNVVVYLPGAPNPWSGSVVYVTEDRVEPLDMAPQDAIKNIRVLGRGSAKIASAGL
jgi:uncharacterized membrane protein